MAKITRNDYRRQTVTNSRPLLRFLRGIILTLSILPALPLFLGDLLAAPFVARRHESTFRWLLFMAFRMLPPAILIGLCIGYLVRKLK